MINKLHSVSKKIILSPFYLFGFCLTYGPFFLTRSIAIAYGIFLFDILRFRRKIVLNNLLLAFPQMTLADRVKLGRRSLILFCQHFFEFFKIPFLTDRWISKNIIFEGADHLIHATKKNQGIFFLSLHLGHGDLIAALVQMKFYPVLIITKFFKNAFLNLLWFTLRGAKGVGFIRPHGRETPFQILKSLKAQKGVCFVMDQFMGRPYALENYFFGIKTGTAFGLALFYLKTRTPVVPIYSYSLPNGQIQVVIEPEMQLDKIITGDHDKDLLLLTQAFNDKLEEIIRKYPEEWMWIHRRWKEYE